MKRTEMLSKLAKELAQLNGASKIEVMHEFMAKRMLELVEQSGMAPPETQIQYVREFNGTVISWNKSERKWEPE